MIKAGRKKLWISVLLVLLVTALTAGLALMFTSGGKTAFADEPLPEDEQPGYHVNETLTYDKLKTEYVQDFGAPISHDEGNWAEYQKTGNEATVYKAVFPETAKTAWIGISIVRGQHNAKVEVSNDGTEWVEKLVATKDESVYSLPEDLLMIQTNGDGDHHCYLDVTDLLKTEGPSPIYVRLGAVEGNANCLGLFQLKFFEGNVFTAPNTVLGPQDLADISQNTLKQDGWFANSTTLANGAAIGVNGNGAFMDGYCYGLWTMLVPAAAKEVSFGTHEQNGNAMQKITVFVNGKKVGEPRTFEHNKAHPHAAGQWFDLTEDVRKYLGTDFRLTIMIGDSTPTGGDGPQMKYLEFNYAIPAAESLSELLPAGAENDVIAEGEKLDGFLPADMIRGLNNLASNKVTAYKDPAKATPGPNHPEVMDYAEVYYGLKTKDTNTPFFDGAFNFHGKYVRTFGIFKLHYGENEGKGLLKVPVAGSYLLKLMSAEKAVSRYDETEKTGPVEAAGDETRATTFHYVDHSDIKFADVDNEVYTTIASKISPIVGGKTLYIDVSEYLDEAGGTLYLFVTDPTLADGNGPNLNGNIELYTYSIDNTPFTAEAPEELYIGGPKANDTVTVSLKTKAEGEGIGSIKLGDTMLNITSNDYAWVDDDEFTELIINRKLFTEAKIYTIELTSNKNAARTATVSIEVKQDVVSGISVKTQPTKTSYTTGDTLDFAGGKLELTWLSGGKTEIALTATGVTASATTAQETAGTQTVTFTYADKTATVELTVSEKATTPEPENPGTTPGGSTENPDVNETPADNNAEETGKGCSGSIAGSSAAAIILLLMATVALLAVGAYVVKKK